MRKKMKLKMHQRRTRNETTAILEGDDVVEQGEKPPPALQEDTP